jgi:hypothetical protein
MPGNTKLETADELWDLYNNLEKLKGLIFDFYVLVVLRFFQVISIPSP